MSRRRLSLATAVVLAAGIALLVATIALAAVTVTPASGGTNISADRAQNATSPLWTTLGNIVVTENNNADFAVQTGTTLILTAPSNWRFNSGVGSVSHQSGRNITSSSISVTASTITVTLSVGGTNKTDVLTISGIQVQAIDGAQLPSNGNILRTSGNPGSATIAGITNDSTNFGSLSQVVGNRTKLGITSVNGGSNPTAGTAFSVVVQSQDQFGNAANVVAATGVSLSLNTGTGTLGGTLTGTIGAGTSSVTINGATYTKAESGVVLTATRTSGDTLTAGNSAPFTVNPGALDHFAVEAQGGGPIGTQTAGTSFNIRVTAQDALNNTVTGYTSTVDISSTGNLTLGSGTTAAFSAGVLASHTARISNTGSFTITATRTSGGSQSGTSNSFTVDPGALDHFAVEAQGGGPIGTQTAGTSFNIRVTAQDALNNTVTGYTSTVDISSTGNLTLGSGTTAAFSAGVLASHTARISNTGSFTITATRTSGGSQSGTSNSFTVNSGVASKLAITVVPGTVAVGAGFSVTVQSQDAIGNPSNVVAATGISLSGSGSGLLSGNTDTIAAGTNTKTLTGVSYDTAQTITLTASRTSGDTLSDSAPSSSIVFTARPISTITFPSNGSYNAAGWAAGCASAGFCGTATDNSGSGLAAVELSIQHGSGNYWDGDGFDSGSEVFVAASLAGSNWSYGFGSGSFPANDFYTVRARATDNLGGVESALPSQTFTYDTVAPIGLTITSPVGPTNDATPNFSGAAGTALGDATTVTVKVYDSVPSLVQTRTAPVAAGSWLIDASPALADGSYTATATQTDAANNSTTTSALAFTVDTSAPAPPGSLATSPASPANDNNPKVTGSAEAGSTVKLYTTSDCSGAPVASGSAAMFGGAGIVVPAVSDNTSTTYRATATDTANNDSLCSSGVTYVEDSAPPSTTVTFPSALGTYDDSAWNAGCATAGLCGTASDSGGAGLLRVELSLKRESDGTYWDGDGFDSASEAWLTASGTSSWSYGFAASSFPADGDYTLRARAVDNASNTETASSRTFTYENSPPETTIDSGPANPTNLTDATFAFSASESGSTFECRLDGGGWGSCTSPESYSGLSQASHTFEARASDSGGNTDPTPASYLWTLDTTNPSSTISFPAASATYNPTGWNSGCTSSLCGTATDTGGAGLQTVQLSLKRESSGLYWDGDSFDAASETWVAASGTASWSYSFPASSFPAGGDYTLRVRAVDSVTNTESPPQALSFTLDPTPPSSTVTFPAASAVYNGTAWNAGCAPSGLCGTASDTGGSGLAQVEFSLKRDSNGLYWDGDSFDAGGELWVAASGTATWWYGFAVSSFPADGDYTLSVRAVDNAANQEAASSRTFTIDTVAPETQIDSSPPDPTNSQNASFTFSANEAGTTFECRLDAGSWSPCTSPDSYSSLAEGSHSFRVQATDAAGNLDATPALHTWTIDLTNPTVALDFPSDGAFYNVSSWNAGCNPNGICGTANDAGGAGLQNVQVSVRRVSDGTYWNGSGFSSASEDWQTASGTASWNLAFPASNFPADEAYSVRVRSNDSAGNASAPLARTFTIDGVPPQTTIDSGPSNPSSSANASFSFSANEPGSTFECRLDAGSWAACTSPESYGSLAEGPHTFDVRATDLSGNPDLTPASSTWVVDTLPPTGSMDNPGPYLRGSVSLSASAADSGGTGVASVTFQRSPAGAGTWTPIATDANAPYSFDWDTTGVADNLYDLRVVIVDNATNTTNSLAVPNVRVDNTPPDAVMDDPGANVSGTVTLSHSSTDDGSGIAPASVQFEYRSSPGGPWTPTGTSWDTTALADGFYDLQVSVADRAGNTDVSSAVTTRVDNTPPEVSITSPTDDDYVNASSADPRTVVASATDLGSGVATVEFFACSDASLECATGTWTSLGVDSDGEPYEGSWPLPADGNRALKAVATDNADQSAFTVIDVTVDRTVPDTTITVQPADPSNVATPTFEFESNELDSTFECQVDGAGWAVCASPYTPPALSDAIHTFEVRAIDLAGNIDASPATMTWLVDTTPPTASMNDPGTYLRGTVTLMAATEDPGANASGIATIDYQYSADAINWASTAADWDTTLVSDGLYAVRVVVIDNAGNVTESAPITDRMVDNTPPATAIDDPGANIRQLITLTGSATDDGSGVLEVDFQYTATGGSSWTTISTDTGAPYDAPFDTASVPDGLYDFRTVARDAAGNETEGTPILSRRIDNTPPTATMNDPGAYLRGTVTLTSVADDLGGSGVSSVVYEVSPAGGGSWTPVSGTWDTATVGDGVYDLHVVVTDVAGNQTISAPVGGKVVDNTPPTTTDNAPSGWQSGAVTVTLSPGDGSGSGVSNTQLSVDGGGYSSGTSVTIPAPSDGSNDGVHTIAYFSTDVAGNVESPKTATVSIDASPPVPGANDPGTYLSGTVTLSANPSDPNEIESVEFQRSDVSGWVTIGVDADEPYSVQWNTGDVADGPYDLRVVVTDEAGNESTEDLPGKIVDNTPPSASVGSPPAGSVVSGNVTIGATALDANPITSVEFFVGGGSIGSATEPPFTRSWDSTSGPDGSVSIYVVVTDIAGHSTTSGSISVTVDNFAPAVTLGDPGPTGRGIVPLSASADGDTVQVSFERRPAGGGGWTTIATDIGAPWAADFDTSLVPDGMYDLRAIAVDGGSNSGTSNVQTMRVDNTLPSGSLTAPGGGSTVGGSAVPVAANASDSGSGVALVIWEYRPAGGGGYSYSASDSSAPYQGTWDPSSLASGDYEVHVIVRDVAGNEFAGAPVTVTVDSDPPTVTLDNPGALLSGIVALTAQVSGGAISVTFAYSPAGAGSWTTIGVDTAAPWTRSFNTASVPDGLYDLRATAVDAVGNTASSVVAGVRIDNFTPSIVSSVPANNSIVAAAGSIQITVSEEIDALLSVTLDGAPTVPPILSGSQATFNTGALGPGGHTLKGTIRDKAGKTRAFTIFFTIGTPPPPPPEPTPGPGPAPDPGLGPSGTLGCLAPLDFEGDVGIDGTLTVHWKSGKTSDGKPCDTILYVDGIATLSFPATQTKAGLGPISAADTRVFTLFAVGPDGTISGPSDSIRAVPAVFGHTLAEATALLDERGFEVGAVVGAGTVVEPSGVMVARKGSAIDLVLREPQAKLVFQVVGAKRFSWAKARHLAARIKTTKQIRVAVSLVSPRGERLYRWRTSTKAGASIVKLRMPRHVRRPAVYRLVFTGTAGTESVKRTIRFRLVGRKLPRIVRPGAKPVDIVLAGSGEAGDELALGLTGPTTRVIQGNGDSAFDLAGDANHNVQVIVVDVDRYGVRLVRDLHTVFPLVPIVALSNDPRKLALAIKAGATVALSKSTPPDKLAKIIRRLAHRS